MPKAKAVQDKPATRSRQTSLLIFVKCLCETAAENYEKALASELPQDERVWAEELQSDIAAAHRRIGELLGKEMKNSPVL